MTTEAEHRVIEAARNFAAWATAATAHGQRYSISAQDIDVLGSAVDVLDQVEARWVYGFSLYRRTTDALAAVLSDTCRQEREYTERQFDQAREDLLRQGIELREITRVPYADPQIVR